MRSSERSRRRRSGHLHARGERAGLPPGALADSEGEPGEVVYQRYSKKSEASGQLAANHPSLVADPDTVLWVHATSSNGATLRSLGERFDIHPLTLEDIASSFHRPKVEFYDGYVAAFLKLLTYDDEQAAIREEQLSLILLDDSVLSFSETDRPLSEPIRQRIKLGHGRIRRKGADYLFYALIDLAVDLYFPVLDRLETRIENLENTVSEVYHTDLVQELHSLRQDLLVLRKSIWPVRELLASLQREKSTLLKKKDKIYVRNIHDHVLEVSDAIESFGDRLNGVYDLHFSVANFRLNQVMKFLTVMSAIFIPLSFVTGIYGMNFQHMPELLWRYGYFTVLGVLGILGLGILWFLRRKRWL